MRAGEIIHNSRALTLSVDCQIHSFAWHLHRTTSQPSRGGGLMLPSYVISSGISQRSQGLIYPSN